MSSLSGIVWINLWNSGDSTQQFSHVLVDNLWQHLRELLSQLTLRSKLLVFWWLFQHGNDCCFPGKFLRPKNFFWSKTWTDNDWVELWQICISNKQTKDNRSWIILFLWVEWRLWDEAEVVLTGWKHGKYECLSNEIQLAHLHPFYSTGRSFSVLRPCASSILSFFFKKLFNLLLNW